MKRILVLIVCIIMLACAGATQNIAEVQDQHIYCSDIDGVEGLFQLDNERCYKGCVTGNYILLNEIPCSSIPEEIWNKYLEENMENLPQL